jgi:hypothetical protein
VQGQAERPSFLKVEGSPIVGFGETLCTVHRS